jgi:hypothetical protein
MHNNKKFTPALPFLSGQTQSSECVYNNNAALSTNAGENTQHIGAAAQSAALEGVLKRKGVGLLLFIVRMRWEASLCL